MIAALVEADAAAAVSAGGFRAGGFCRVGGARDSASEEESADNESASAAAEDEGPVVLEDRAGRREGGWVRVNNSRVEVVVEAKVF